MITNITGLNKVSKWREDFNVEVNYPFNSIILKLQIHIHLVCENEYVDLKKSL